MIKIGILGAGRVVQNRYLDVFQNELKNVQVKAVCDKITDRAETVAHQLQCQAVISEEELLADPDIDAILIATESGNHFQHSCNALNAGKHVIVEKPPAMFPDEVLKCESLALEKGLMYAVIFQNRFNPAMKILKETYQNGRFGKSVLITIRLRWCRYQDYYEDGWHGTWKMDGGVINQQAIHHIDALEWVCGSITEVCSKQNNILNQLEAEDTTVAILQFKNGALGVVEATTAARPEDFEASMSIVGEKGIAVIGGVALNKIDRWQFVDPSADDAEIPEKYSQDVPTGYGLSHGPLMQEIVDRLNRGEIIPPITGSSTISVVRLVHALYRSSEDNGWVTISDDSLSSRLGR